MKILIINQHSKNHGDEAAGLALIRNIYKKGYTNISVSYNMGYPWNEKCELKHKDIKHLVPIKFNRFSYRSLLIFNNFPCFLTKIFCLVFKELRKEYNQIKHSDLIISASGGVNLGLYRDSRYLWRLLIAKKIKKKYVIYSPSIGPFFENDKKYFKQAKAVLKGAAFLSLRDKKSYEYAEQFKVPFVKSIDTAFLENHNDIQLPEQLNLLVNNKYVIIVPNQLYNWHPSFKGILSAEKIDVFYTRLISIFNNIGRKVVLLPQLYEQGDKNDEDYFLKLKDNNKNVIVISTQYSSDLQQKIIEKAEFVVGARYHTIIFAINNNTPFCCLSYEHKMSDMLDLLDLKSYSLDIKHAFEHPETTLEKIMGMYDKKVYYKKKLANAKLMARKIASDCFKKFCDDVL